MNTDYIWRDYPPLTGRHCYGRGREARERDETSPVRDSPSSLQMHSHTFSIWNGVFVRFPRDYYLCWSVESLLTRRPSTGTSLHLQAKQKVSMPYCLRVFGDKTHFSAYLPLLALVKNVSIMNPSLYPLCSEGGFTLWLNCQGTFEASTLVGADASLLSQQQYGLLESAESL